MKADYTIRCIEPRDNEAVEKIIRSCLIEFGGDHEGTAWADPMLGRFSEVYSAESSRYWVAEDVGGKVVGGCGIGPLDSEGLCELQKMYLLPEARGTGLAQKLMKLALEFASEHYTRCYIETLENMTAAQRFYQHCGFVRIYDPPVRTEHYACGVRYIKEL